MSQDKNDSVVQLSEQIEALTKEIHQRNKKVQITPEGASILDIDSGVSIIERAIFYEKARELLIFFLKSLPGLRDDPEIQKIIKMADKDQVGFFEKSHELLKSLYDTQKDTATQDLIDSATKLPHEIQMISPVIPDPAYLKTYKRYEVLMKNIDENLSSKEQIQASLVDLKTVRDELKQLQNAINKFGIEIEASEYSPKINEKENYLSRIDEALNKVEKKLDSLKKYDTSSTKDTKMTLLERAEKLAKQPSENIKPIDPNVLKTPPAR